MRRLPDPPNSKSAWADPRYPDLGVPIRVLPLLILMPLLLQDAPAAKAPDKCSVSGAVVDSVTGEPLNKVAVRMWPIGRENAVSVSTTSDGTGKFALVELDPGSYYLRADRSGYVEMVYGARHPDGNGTIIRLDAGQAVNDIRVQLMPGGVIGGTVRDSDGEPIEGAQVELRQVAFGNRGKPQMERTRSAQSDDRGEYRFHGLPSGKYYVSAGENGSNWGEVDHSAAPRPADISVTTFYPGTPDASAASPIQVGTGKRITGVDLTLVKTHAVCISGQVAMPAAAGRVILSLDTANSTDVLGRTTSPRNAAGDFQFCRVPSGSYVLQAFAGSLSARAPILVGSVDVKDVRLIPVPGAEIQGRVVTEGPEKIDLGNIMVQIEQEGRNLVSVPAIALRNGAFTLKDQRPGQYDVRIKFPPPGYYVKSVRSNETDILADGLTIVGPGMVPLEVMLSGDGSGVRGMVRDKDQQLVAGATVLVVPDQRSRQDLYQQITTDQSGRYEFSSLAPGKYKVFAWDDVAPNAWYDPDFLKDYEKQAEAADLSPKTKANIDLHIGIPPEAR